MEFPRTLSERIYLHLKDSIIKGKIKSNQVILEKEIAESFGVSITPVREALRRLAGEGLIQKKSHKVSLVKMASYNELKEIYNIINSLDELSICTAVMNISEEALEEIEKMTDELEALLRKEKIKEYLEINLKLHLKICQGSNQKFLYKTLSYLFDNLAIYSALRIYLLSKSDCLDQDLIEHRHLLEGLKTRDKKKVMQFSKRHWIGLLPSYEEWEEYIENQKK